jgi:hypothetical protein
MKKALICMILAFNVGTAMAEPDMPLEQRQKLAAIENAIAKLNNLQAIVEESSRVRKEQCLQAFGHRKFCTCIGENLPVALTFQNYVSITTHTKQENNYSSLNKEDKKIYDLSVSTRDQCVKQL